MFNDYTAFHMITQIRIFIYLFFKNFKNLRKHQDVKRPIGFQLSSFPNNPHYMKYNILLFFILCPIVILLFIRRTKIYKKYCCQPN